jgi:hypothetical protein
MQLRDIGTQRGLREGTAAAVHGNPAHATQAAQNMAGVEKRLLLVFPQQSRNKQTMALVLSALRHKVARGLVRNEG